jgi:hypothetical protein
VLALGLQHGDPLANLCVVLSQQAQSLGHGWFPLSGQFGIATHGYGKTFSPWRAWQHLDGGNPSAIMSQRA